MPALTKTLLLIAVTAAFLLGGVRTWGVHYYRATTVCEAYGGIDEIRFDDDRLGVACKQAADFSWERNRGCGVANWSALH